MLSILIGTDWTANRSAVLAQIAKDVADKKKGRILIVPELISHETERRLCAAAGDSTCRYAEVLTFTRLVRKVSEFVGCGSPNCMDGGGRVVAMASATRQLHSKLKAYAAVETKPEFLMQLVEAVDEFKRCCVSAKDLMYASKETTGAFAQKLEELSLILDAYDGICNHGKKDPRDQMVWLLEQLEDSGLAQEHVFYIDGFSDFSKQQLMVIEHLIRNSPNVTVSLSCDRVDSNNPAFEKAADTALQLRQMAERLGVDCQISKIDADTDALHKVCEKLFQGAISADPQLAGRLTVYRSQSVFDECTAVAQQVMELVRTGARYRDFVVICSDMGTYRNVLRSVFERFRIPLYLAGSDSVLDKSVVATVLAALSVVTNGFEQKDVFRYIRSAVSPLDLQQSDLLENYAILWNISGNEWKKTWVYHPGGLSQNWTEQDQRVLDTLNNIRANLIDPLVALQKALDNSANLAQQVHALYAFLEQTQVAQRLQTMAEYMDANGDNRSAQILNQLWDILLDALEQLHDVLGETAWDADIFTRLLKLLLSQYDVGTIPTALDTVLAGPVNAMRCQKSKHLFVLGAVEGSLPGYCSQNSVLTESERVSLRNMGIPLNLGALDSLQTEFHEIYGVFCGAKNAIHVSCPSGQPSFLYRRLCVLAGGETVIDTQLGAAQADERLAGAYLARYDAFDIAKRLDLEEAYQIYKDSTIHSLGTIGEKNIKRLYGQKLNLSASQIDTQADCRLSYFLKYGLRAKERKSASVDPAEFGTYVHWVLEQTGRTITAQNGFPQVSLEQTLAIAKEHSDRYIAEHFGQLESQRLSYLFRRNAMELEMIVCELWQELQESKFQPEHFELNFGDDGQLPAIAVPGSNMDAQLRGYVDRVDTWDNGGVRYFRVVDYKTGKKDFDYCDVFNGIGLQMLLYLFALKKSSAGSVPVGVQYFPARAPIVAADGILTDEEAAAARDKLWKRKGLLLNDEAVLQAMEPGDNPKRSFTRKKDGTVSGELADSGQFNMLMGYVFRLVGRMVDDISSGCVEPNPYTRGSSHNACMFCPYGAICNKETVDGRRNYKAMDAKRFWDEIGKEMNKNG